MHSRKMLALVVFVALPLVAQTAELDRIASNAFPAGKPGAAVRVEKGGKVLLRAGYGMADLEQGTKITPESAFRIGSITKQFTAVAILQLVEAGKIRLDDPLTRFIPDYPVKGKPITVEHLLTHTSGIQSYTDKPDFAELMRNDLAPMQLIDTFKNDAPKSEPGAVWAYNNSGYILLGAIIEKASGMPYDAYLEKNVFPRAGMTNTYYGSNARIVPNRVPGYAPDGDGFVNASYISMTLPYAAGSLVSTVDDLARWNAALAAGKVVDRKLLDKAWTSAKLTSGEETGYGYGWAVGKLAGERVIQHGGGINGYTTSEMWLPEHDVYVVVLTNNEATRPAPEYLAGLLALQAIGKPWKNEPIAVTPAELEQYAGVYRIDENSTRTLSVEDGKLMSQRSGGAKYALIPVAPGEFAFADSFNRLTFERDASGKIIAAVVGDGAMKSRAVRTDEKPAVRTEITLPPETLDRYPGRYELVPGFVLTITRKGNELWSQATGQPEVQIFPESESSWFLKVVDAQLYFEFDEKGIAKKLTLHQGGRAMPAKKLPQ